MIEGPQKQKLTVYFGERDRENAEAIAAANACSLNAAVRYALRVTAEALARGARGPHEEKFEISSPGP